MVLATTLSMVCGALVLAAPQSPTSSQAASSQATSGQAASGQAKRAVMPKELANSSPIDPAQDHVVVKLVEQRPDVAVGGMIVAREVREVIGNRLVQPFFLGLEEQLQQLRARQLAATPAGSVPAVDLGLYFDVKTRNGAETRELIAALNALDTVELAYARELATEPPGSMPPGDILPVTPDFTGQQGYRGAPPTGIDGDAITYTTGGMGSGIKVLDIEWGWTLQHEDLAALRPSSLVGPPIFQNSFNDHGTAVAGIIVADSDIYGVTGFNPDVQFFVVTNYPSTGYSVANAIATGLSSLGSGDVMVLEAQTNTPLGLGPTEWNQADFDAILIATGLGIITVEAAGNGGVNLDSASLGGLFNTSVRDSGAIIVGASNGSSLSRASFSSYGTRIDANGWGRNVVSTGYGNLFNPGDVRQHYTAVFSGTSSATPIVTGAIVALRGAAVAQLHPVAAATVNGFTIRSLLRAHGTPISNIGNRPDAQAMLDAAGITTGMSIRNEPRTGQTCHIDLVPQFAATANDFYAFVGSLMPDNVAMPAPFTGRYLIGSTLSSPLGFGTFSSIPATATITIPNSTSYYGLRYYMQGFTFEGATGTLTAANSVQLFVRR